MTKQSGLRGPALAVLIGAGGLVVGSFMSWVTVSTVFGEQSLTGIDRDGKITAACGAIVALLILTTMAAKRNIGVYLGCVVVSIAGGATAIYDWVNLATVINESSNTYATAAVGGGLYVCAGGAVVACLAAITGAAEAHRSGSAEPALTGQQTSSPLAAPARPTEPFPPPRI